MRSETRDKDRFLACWRSRQLSRMLSTMVMRLNVFVKTSDQLKAGLYTASIRRHTLCDRQVVPKPRLTPALAITRFVLTHELCSLMTERDPKLALAPPDDLADILSSRWGSRAVRASMP